MLKLPEFTPQRVQAVDIENNPCPSVLMNVSSLVPSKRNMAMDKTVKFEENFQGKKKTQFLAAFAANMGAFAIGTIMCWTATALPDMRANPSNIGSLIESQEALVSSIVTLGAAAACPWTGFFIEIFGRRMTMLGLTVPFVVGWLLIAFADRLAMIYAGRFITGFCGGAFSMAAPIFIAETAAIDIRGKLSAGFDMMITVGMLFVFLLGKFLPWRLQALVCGFIPIIFHLLMFFVPESPRYLISKGKEAQAADALMWLRGAWIPEQIQSEFNEIVNSINERRQSIPINWKGAVCNRGSLKAVAIGMTLFFFQVACGIDAILFYTVDIFRQAGTSVDEHSSTIILGVAQVAAALVSALTVDKFGRRFFLLASEIFMILPLAAFGAFFYFKLVGDEAYVVKEFGWAPLVSLIVYVVAFSIGLGPIPYGMMAEILPLNIKGIGSSLLLTTRWLLCFVITLFFNEIMEALGRHGGYWILASLCILGAVFIYLCVPETKGKSLEEIQRRYISKE